MAKCRSKPEIAEFFSRWQTLAESRKKSRDVLTISQFRGFPDRPANIEKEKQNRQKSDSTSVCQWPGNWVVAKLVKTSVGTSIWLLTLIFDYCDRQLWNRRQDRTDILLGQKYLALLEPNNWAEQMLVYFEHEWSKQSYTLYRGGGGEEGGGGGGRELPWVDGLRQPVSERAADAGGHWGQREGGGRGNT